MRFVLFLSIFLLSGCPTILQVTPEVLEKCLMETQPFVLDLERMKKIEDIDEIFSLLEKHIIELPSVEYVQYSDKLVKVSTASEDDIITSGHLISNDGIDSMATCMQRYAAAVPHEG